MDFKQVVGKRRSIRYYQPWRPVEKEKIQKILEAARLQSMHGNASAIRKAVVVTKGETPDNLRKGLVEALYSQPAAEQAPVHIIWTLDMAEWEKLRGNLTELIKVRALNSSYGWSEKFIDEVVMPTADFNVMAGDRKFAEWLSSFECGLAVGSALLAAVDEGLGTQLLTGKREDIRKLFGMPESVTPTQIQILGYPAESAEAGGQRPRPDFEKLYFNGKWGVPLKRDPKVVAELQAAGMIQASAPLPWRAQEVRALAATFGLPE
jgi:nitroreductase